MSKSIVTVFLTVFILLIFLPTVWGQSIFCGNGSSGGQTVMKLSTTENAHAEVPTQSNYNTTKINCRIAGGGLAVTENNTNPVIILSNNTNAHAQSPGQVGYSYPISLTHNTGSIHVEIAGPGMAQGTCIGYNDGTETYVELVRLSSLTNAHLESPYGGTPAQEYPYSICVAYNAAGTVSQDILLTGEMTGIPVDFVELNQTYTGTVSVNDISTDPNFIDVRTVLINSICDLDDAIPANRTACAAASNSSAYYDGLVSDATGVIFKHRESIQFDMSLLPYDAMPNPVSGPQQGNLDVQTPPGTGTKTYNFDPTGMGLIIGHTYRIHSLALYADYFDGTPGIRIDKTEGSAFIGNNMTYFDVEISPPGGAALGTGGDIYVLKKIEFPNVYANGNIVARITVENKRPDIVNENHNLNIIIRDSRGSPLEAFGNPEPAVFQIEGCEPLPAPGTSCTKTIDAIIQSASAIPFLQIGETYTLYATAVPYQDTDGDPNNSETIIANNSAFRTFTALEPLQTFSIPDNPWWMGLGMIAIVLGWLFVSARRAKKTR